MIAVGNCKLQNGIWVHEIVRQIQIEQLCNYDKNIAKSCLSCIITLSMLGWSGVVKLSCILRHRDVQLILAYSWARFGILVAGEGRGGNVFISSVSLLSLLFLFLPCPSLLSLLSLFFLSLRDDTKWSTRADVSLNPNTINQKSRCHAHFKFSAIQITWSRLLIQIHILNNKQYRARSLGFIRSQLIWIYTGCKDRACPGSAGLGLLFRLVDFWYKLPFENGYGLQCDWAVKPQHKKIR